MAYLRRGKIKLTQGLFLSALILSSICSGKVQAAEVDQLETFALDQIVVTATRSEKRDVDVAASTTILTAKDLQNTGASNIQTALAKVPGLAYKTFGPGGSALGTMSNEITIRGVSNGTLVMINGSPINLRGKYYLDSIPVENVERVEIIKGGGAVLYGSEAMGGVINIIMKKEFANSITAGVGNYGQQKYDLTLNADKLNVGYNLEKWGNVNTISKRTDKGNQHTDATGSEKNSILMEYNFNDKLQLMYNYLETEASYDTWFDGAYKSVPATGSLQQNRKYGTKQNVVQLNYTDDNFKAKAYYNQNKLTANGFTKYDTSGNLKNSIYDTDEKNRAYGVDLQKNWDLNAKTKTILGFTYQNEFYTDYATKKYDRNNLAFYGQWEQKLSDLNTLTLSARETWTTGAPGDQNYNNFSAQGQLSHKLAENENLYASVGQSFIMPTFAQMYGSSDTAVPNPGLKEQTGVNYEMGWKKISGDHSWKMAVYHIDIKDNIGAKWNKTKSYYTYKNEDFTNTGLELTADIHDQNGWSYNWGINLSNPKAKQEGSDWDRKYGKLQVTGGVTYAKDKWRSSLTGSYMGKRVAAPSSEKSSALKPYFLTSLTTTYICDKNSEITLSLENIFDRKDILNHSGSEYYATPFNFLLSYNYKF